MAVKIINKEKARKDPYVYKNLRREGRLLQRGHHKHVISIYDTLGKIYWSTFFSGRFFIVIFIVWPDFDFTLNLIFARKWLPGDRFWSVEAVFIKDSLPSAYRSWDIVKKNYGKFSAHIDPVSCINFQLHPWKLKPNHLSILLFYEAPEFTPSCSSLPYTR